MTDLRAPFPYFGGKGRAASLAWARFGRVVNFVEPFAGSLAVLLSCPKEQRPRVETVNDIDAHLANVWRSIAWHSEKVATACDWPVNEVDLHARHKHLLARIPEMRAKLDADPKWCDPEIAGWWVWGASAWIGSGWCEEGKEARTQAPHLGGGQTTEIPRENFGKGVHAAGMREPSRQLPDLIGAVGNPGKASGVHNKGMRAPSRRLPDLAGGTLWGTDEPNARAGRGVHSGAARGPSQKLPDVGARSEGGGAGRGVLSGESRTRLYDIFAALSERLRHVRVTCGDWSRICTPAVTYRHGLTAVLLDPPYEGHEHVYGSASVSADVRAWAIENGERPDMRIALCGYEGEHDMPATWECVAWKAKGGYGNQRREGENENARRERIWFSPHCLKPGRDTGQIEMFSR